MGITQVIDPFYQSIDLRAPNNRPVVGQFCWIAAPHLDKLPRIMEVARENATEHYATKFKIRNMTDQDFRKKQATAAGHVFDSAGNRRVKNT